MNRNLILLMCLLFTLVASGQSKVELTNRAAFNKIEFFINTQMTDSIYNLASEHFKSQVSENEFAYNLNNIYQLGKIENVTIADFKGTTATYRVRFSQQEQDLLAKFSLDSTLHYDLLLFTAAPEKEEEKVPEKSDVISNVEKESPLDFYIDSLANTYVKKGNAQSLSIGIFHNNKYKAFFYGETEKGNQTLPTETSLYEIGSITKIFTATLLADLVTKNTLSLDDSITKFLPDSVKANPALKGITFKTLANHTSGLPRLADNWQTVPGFKENDPYAAYDRKALFSFLKHYEAKREPGEQYEYSNVGFGLLGELISIITKKPYTTYLRETILTPLQMANTTDKVDGKKQHQLKVYDEKGEETPAWNWKAMVSAGGLKSDVKDLMLFAVEQFKMPENGLQNAMALTRQFTALTPDNMDIGLAWHMNMFNDLIYFHHTGGTAGSSSFIGLSPDTKTAIVVLSNAAENVGNMSTLILEKLLESR